MNSKTVLVTGSTRGIGKSIAIEFVNNGYNVILHSSKDTEIARKTYNEVRKTNNKVKMYFADITNHNEVVVFCSKIVEDFKNVDVLINNAGIVRDKTFQKMSFDEWDKVIQTNLYGTFRVTQALLPHISNAGRIINISSVIAQTGGFGQTNYSASKSAILGFTKSLALELCKKEITVNAICPGFTDTDMTKKIPKEILETRILPKIPLGRLAKPMEIAKLALYLASDEAGYITGQAININGGLY